MSLPVRLTKDARVFLKPRNATHRQYEALRASFVEGLKASEATVKFGQTYSSFQLTRMAKSRYRLLGAKVGNAIRGTNRATSSAISLTPPPTYRAAMMPFWSASASEPTIRCCSPLTSQRPTNPSPGGVIAVFASPSGKAHPPRPRRRRGAPWC